MNLDQITTKCYILALFIRDDGERLLLGDGFYEFTQKLQHFQPNTYENDIVPLQGSDGQLLAGQVRRTATQSFDGYIGDATANRQIIEQKRTDFLTFFRKKHFYKVIYIFPDGTAIQRKRGYIVDAPSVPELWQRFPEYHIGLNFEDVNYYEYAEDEFGDEIYAHIINIALSSALEGGLVWDAIGAITDGITWSNIQTTQGEYITINNALDIPAKLAGVEMLGKAEQSGTPTPDAPIPVQTVTGENVVKITGKNLLPTITGSDTYSGVSLTSNNGTITATGTATASMTFTLTGTDGIKYRQTYWQTILATTTNSVLIPKGTYYFSGTATLGNITIQYRLVDIGQKLEDGTSISLNSSITLTEDKWLCIAIYVNNTRTPDVNMSALQLELGSTATAYAPYQGQEFEVNLGKNLLKPYQTTGSVTANGLTISMNSDGTILVDGTSTGNSWIEFVADFKSGTSAQTTPQVLLDSTATYTLSSSVLSGTTTATPIIYIQPTSGTGEQYATLGNAKTFTDATGIYRGWLRFSANQVFNNTKIGIMVEHGSSATSFAPYFTPIELCKIGTYQDYIWNDGGTWKIHKATGKRVIDGTEDGWVWSDTNRYTVATSNVGARLGLSNNFTYQNYNGAPSTDSPSFDVSSNLASIGFFDDTISSLTNFKTWLGSHPTTVYYALATPTDNAITEQALIDQLNALGASSLYVGVNNIGTDTLNATPTLKIGYYTEYDEAGAGYEWEPGGGGQNIVSVEGLDNAYPIWTITGQATNPTLTNITTGQTITWNGTVPAGQTLTIDMNEMTADLAGANVFEYISGEWLYLQPGNNSLTYTASGGATDDSILSWNGVAG